MLFAIKLLGSKWLCQGNTAPYICFAINKKGLYGPDKKPLRAVVRRPLHYWIENQNIVILLSFAAFSYDCNMSFRYLVADIEDLHSICLLLFLFNGNDTSPSTLISYDCVVDSFQGMNVSCFVFCAMLLLKFSLFLMLIASY